MRLALALLLVLLVLALGATPAWATFPTVAATNTSTNASTTSHTVNLPSGIAAGHLLVACLSVNGVRTADWSGAGFTELFDLDTSASNSLSCAWKTATGSEGASITVTTNSTGQPSTALSWRITGQHDSSAPEVDTPAAANSADPDPAATSVTWGAEENLWLVVVGVSNNATFTDDPDNYTNCIQPTSAESVDIRGCQRANTTASENPNTFGLVSQGWIAATIGIRPAAAPVVGSGLVGSSFSGFIE